MYNYGGIYTPLSLNQGPEMSINYWTRSLFQRLTALLKIENIPQQEDGQYGWDYDALMYGLLFRGFLAVFESKKYGIVPQPCTLTGFGLQYQPTNVVINTPYFQLGSELRIGFDTELLRLTPDYTGIFDIIAKYAAELKEIDTSIKASARNSRFAYALVADSDKAARTLKNVREKIINGDDVIIDEKIMRRKGDTELLPWYEFDRDLRNSYILGDLLEARRTTLVDFYREIGVRMLDDKKERMISSEVDAGNAETFIRSEVWAESLKRSVEKVNAMFGTDMRVVVNRPDILGAEEGGADDVR